MKVQKNWWGGRILTRRGKRGEKEARMNPVANRRSTHMRGQGGEGEKRLKGRKRRRVTGNRNEGGKGVTFWRKREILINAYVVSTLKIHHLTGKHLRGKEVNGRLGGIAVKRKGG